MNPDGAQFLNENKFEKKNQLKVQVCKIMKSKSYLIKNLSIFDFSILIFSIFRNTDMLDTNIN